MKKILCILSLISVMTYGKDLPKLKAEVTEKNNKIEIKISDIKQPETTLYHKIVWGETLSGIAKKYRVSVFQILDQNIKLKEIVVKLQKQNKQIKDIDLIYAGDTLIIRK